MKTIKKKITYIFFLFLFISYYLLNTYFQINIPCVFHFITGLYCPGCGITRMIFSIIKLDFYQAFRYNPLVFILLFCFTVYKITNIIRKKLKLQEYVIPQKLYYIIIIILIIYGIIRNIDIFNYLSPTNI